MSCVSAPRSSAGFRLNSTLQVWQVRTLQRLLFGESREAVAFTLGLPPAVVLSVFLSSSSPGLGTSARRLV